MPKLNCFVVLKTLFLRKYWYLFICIEGDNTLDNMKMDKTIFKVCPIDL